MSDINIGGDVDHDWRAPADILSRLHAHATIDLSRLISDVTRHVADGESSLIGEDDVNHHIHISYIDCAISIQVISEIGLRP